MRVSPVCCKTFEYDRFDYRFDRQFVVNVGGESPTCLEREIPMKNISTKIKKFLKSEDGPTAVEYAVMLALIVIVCLTAIRAVGTNAAARFEQISIQLT